MENALCEGLVFIPGYDGMVLTKAEKDIDLPMES